MSSLSSSGENATFISDQGAGLIPKAFDFGTYISPFFSLPTLNADKNVSPNGQLTHISGSLYMRKLFIGGLSHDTEDDVLRRFFMRWGHVLDAIVIRDPLTRHSRGFGFITYASAEAAERCLADKPHTIKGKEVDSKRAVPRELIGRTETVNSSEIEEEQRIYQSNRKVLLTGLQKAHSVITLRDYFSKFGMLNQIELLKAPYEGFGCLVYEAAKTVETVVQTNYGLHHINNLPVQASAFPDVDPSSSQDLVFSLPLNRPRSKNSQSLSVVSTNSSDDDDTFVSYV